MSIHSIIIIGLLKKVKKRIMLFTFCSLIVALLFDYKKIGEYVQHLTAEQNVGGKSWLLC